ncbi:MAG: c-type cytochrome, partial [Methylococcales bacterium]|nr:c-type cytochrome [Methylococcales bacterium]
VLAKVAGDEDADINLRAEATAGLALNAKDKLPLLISLSGNKNQSIREEALRALRTATLSDNQKKKIKKATQPFPVSSAMAKAITDPASLAAGRPALTNIAAWEKLLDAVKQPVDTEAGRRIFHHWTIAICSNCHRHNGRGNTVGPDLSKISGQGNRTWLLEAILNPNKDIAPQFLPRMITLNDGSVYTGIRLRSYIREQIRDANGQNHTFDRDEVKSIQDLPMSFMPTGLPMSLTDRELRDLVAFLELSAE